MQSLQLRAFKAVTGTCIAALATEILILRMKNIIDESYFSSRISLIIMFIVAGYCWMTVDI